MIKKGACAMRKYYTYSVKEELTKYFQGDTISEMRAYDETFLPKDDNNFIAHAWAHADNVALGYFLQSHFLKETILCDDYIVYIVQVKAKMYAYLLFLHFEDNIPFDLDPQYAYWICEKWKNKGYKTVIMRNCVGTERRNDEKFCFVTRYYDGAGTAFLIPAYVDGQYIFLRESMTFWEHTEAMLYSAITSGLRSEYESVFKDNAVIARYIEQSGYIREDEKYKNTKIIVRGIDEIKEYFSKRSIPSFFYLKNHKSNAYDIRLVSEDNYYTLYIDHTNLICKLIEEDIKKDDILIPVPMDKIPQRILMSDIIDIRPLDVSTMHAYAIQQTYADGRVKNYYIHTFDTIDIPKEFEIDGYKFNETVLNSAEYIKEKHRNGVIFSNGYYIPAHILYYRGKSQMIPERFDDVILENDKMKIAGIYRVPLKISREKWAYRYMPKDDEYYGLNDRIIDNEGNVLSDFTAYYTDEDMSKVKMYKVRSESNHKIGYLRNDRTWIIPPVFDENSSFESYYCTKVKLGEKWYLVNINGEVTPFEYDVEGCFSSGLSKFSIGRYEGEVTYPEEDHFDHLSPGLWGFIDEYGKVVIEPQYVFATGFDYIENRAFVAKQINGKTLWGLIDEKGNEVIPCIYPNLATHSYTAINFQRERGGKYGIMDADGNVIMEPRYNAIFEYDSKHNLIAAGDDWNKIGVARISDGKEIVPFKYEYIGFEEGYIECELSCGGSDYYDYSGKLIADDFRSYKIARNGNFATRKDDKFGVVDADNNIILPFIFDEFKHIDYYEQGYLITGKKGKYGLSKTDGTFILPERYSDIIIKDEFIIASHKIIGNHKVRDRLFLLDGTEVFDDLYRNVHIEDDILTRETPFGTERYHITRHK